jgi:secondary thiamine-phosphate synthase enzyme
MREIALRTERKTQLVEITDKVEEALGEANGAGAAAALVYVPHTTAGVTINEDADPVLAQDIETAMERIVSEGWGEHHDADGPNAPSHIRASLISPQVLVPLSGGRLALGRWQGIFFCEFDGPRDRKVYVTPLR